jgi:hypothetical protein
MSAFVYHNSISDKVYPIATITKAEYDEVLLLVDPSGGNLYAGGINAVISAEGLNQSVVNSKDNGRSNALSDRVTLLVNGLIISEVPTEILDGLMSAGPFYFSWAIDLDPGYYEATLAFDTDTGDNLASKAGVNYTYDSAGNLDLKGSLDLNYNNAAHVHAVTDAGSNSDCF